MLVLPIQGYGSVISSGLRFWLMLEIILKFCFFFPSLLFLHWFISHFLSPFPDHWTTSPYNHYYYAYAKKNFGLTKRIETNLPPPLVLIILYNWILSAITRRSETEHLSDSIIVSSHRNKIICSFWTKLQLLL